MNARRAFLTVSALAWALAAHAVPDTMARDQILEIANENFRLRWYCDTANLYTGVTNATCPYTTTGYKDGIPYKWGGYDSRDAFWLAVVVNKGRAGDTNSAAIVSGTYGDDCSGYASLCLRSGRYTTSSFPNICSQTDYAHLAPGDLMNQASSHVRIFEKYTSTNQTQLFEATTGVSPGRVTRRILATDSKYVPLRYNHVVAWPSIVRATALSSSSAQIEFLGHAATGFRLYRSADAASWTRIADETTLGPLAQSATATGLANATTYYFKVAALNGTAESAASCVFPLRIETGARKALVVSGYDRWTRKSESGGLPHAFLTRYAQALTACGYAFDTVDNLRVIDQSVALSAYSSVWWMLGDESTVDETFSYQEQLRVQDYLKAGGNLFVSGAEIAWDLVNKATPNNDQAFATQYLKIGYASDGSQGNGCAGCLSS